MRTWTEVLSEAERLGKVIANSKWELGDLALTHLPREERGGSRPKDECYVRSIDRLAEMAGAAGVSTEQLRSYRDVADAWPPHKRVAGASWTVHRQLMAPENQHLIQPGLTYREADALVGRSAHPHQPIPSSVFDKVALIKDLLGDKDVYEAVRALVRSAGGGPSEEARPTNPEDWSLDQWDAFDKKVVAASRIILTAFNAQQRGIYMPSVEATAQLALLKQQDLDAELSQLIGG